MPAVEPTPDFSAFTPLLAQVAARGVVRRYRRGVILIQEGEPGGSMYFVLSGLLRAYRARDDGREFTFSFSAVGETVGELSLDGGLRSANVAVESAAQCSCVTRETLLRQVEQQPGLALELIGLLARRARLASSQAAELAMDKVYDRLVRLLRAGSRPEPGGTFSMAYPLTQQQMADQIGCRHSMVNKLLKDLVKGDYLRLEQRPQGRVWVTLRPLPRAW